MLVVKLEILGDIDRRGAIRFDTDSPSTLRTPDGGPIDVQVEDFSRTGFRFTSELDLPDGTLVSLGLSGARSRAAKVVRRSGNTYGCAFMKALTEEEMRMPFAARSMCSPISPPRSPRASARASRMRSRAFRRCGG